MTLPLYKELWELSPQVLASLNRKGNRGLWYDKFCNQWRSEWNLEADKKSKINPKLEWIKNAEWFNDAKRESDEAVIRSLIERTKTLVTANGGCHKVFHTSGPFVSGTGRSHPVENGFCWHHLLGEPYLPGSSVKGMALAWARDWLEESKNVYQRIFGDSMGRGSVIFLDALPVGPITLKADIMTPHYTEYYADGKLPPADWYNPTPIPFLAVEDNQPFLFSVMPAHSDDDGVKDVQQAMLWLEAALANIGAGAKTAVGYGRFKRPDGVADPA